MIPESDRITTKEQLREWLNDEMPRYNIRGGYKLLALGQARILHNFVWLLRNYEYCLNSKKRFMKNIYRFGLIRYQDKYCLHISANTCNKGLDIAHVGPIVINPHACIGKNCRIHVGVNIGTAAGFSDKAPTLGDNVYLGPGVKIFGDIKIADNIIVGANAVVNKNFETSDIAIGGIPAKKISNKGYSFYHPEIKS